MNFCHSSVGADRTGPRWLRAVAVMAAAGPGLAARAAAASGPGQGAAGFEWAGVAAGLLAAGLATAWWRERRARRRAEEKLDSANDRLRVLFDESPLSVYLFDPNDRLIPCRIVECNRYACDLHGWTREEMVGRSLQMLTPVELNCEGARNFLEQLRAGPCRGETPHLRKDGSVFWIEYVARRVVIDGREYMIGVDRDLSAEKARQASEEKLRRTVELNQLVLRASKDGIWDWAVRDGGSVYNDACREMLGYTAEELPDNDPKWTALIHPKDLMNNAELLRRHWEEGVPYVFQYRARHKDGNWRWIISRGITLFDTDGRPVRMVGCRTDITELKRMDAELLHSRKLRAVGEMVGGIAHEFNNLLTPMLLHAELLGMENEGNAKVAAHVGPIRTGIDRARELTQRILTFGRWSVEACEILDLGEVVRDNLKFLAQTIDRRIQITVTPSSGEDVVRANRSDLNQLVMNLLLNARDTLMDKAGKKPPEEWTPRIDILLEPVTRESGSREATDRHTPRRWHRLTVRDNGLGMSEMVRERVFEPFFTTKTVGKGTGLGLATAWHISTALGGWIEIESEEGEGTAFHVFLPAAAQAAMQAEDAGEAGTGVAGVGVASVERVPETVPAASRETVVRRRVLLVEDSEFVAFATQELIRSFGHEVELCADGLAAWKAFSEKQQGYFDVVFTDLNLPGISGVELVRRLRAARYAGRVVVYSGYFSAENQAELEGMAVDHLLGKPFGRAQMVPIFGDGAQAAGGADDARIS